MGGPKRLNKLSNAPDLSKFYNEAGLSAAKKKKKNITGTPGEKEVKTDPFVFVESNIKDQVTKVERGPPRWRHFLNLIQQMRSQKDAPVDTMGCTMLAKRLVDSDVSLFYSFFHTTMKTERLQISNFSRTCPLRSDQR